MSSSLKEGHFETASQHASDRRALFFMRRIVRHPLDGGSDLGRRVLELSSRLHRARAHGCQRRADRALQSAARSSRCVERRLATALPTSGSPCHVPLTEERRMSRSRPTSKSAFVVMPLPQLMRRPTRAAGAAPAPRARRSGRCPRARRSRSDRNPHSPTARSPPHAGRRRRRRRRP
jgi:hypothetical protein